MRQQESATQILHEEKPVTPQREREQERLIRQAKLKEFTESTKAMREHSHVNREEGIEPLPRVRQRADFNEFKRQYEAKNPELASALRGESISEHERNENKALSLVAEFKRLEQMVEKGDRTSPMAQDHLEKLADKLSRQKDIMQYVREHDAPMEKRVNQMVKELQRGRDLELER